MLVLKLSGMQIDFILYHYYNLTLKYRSLFVKANKFGFKELSSHKSKPKRQQKDLHKCSWVQMSFKTENKLTGACVGM